MAKPGMTTFTIEMEIDQSDKMRSNIDEIERTLKDIEGKTKNGLGFDAAIKDTDALIEKVKELAKSEDDSAKEIEAFNKSAVKTTIELERQAVKINHTLSERGKQERARIDEIKKEIDALSTTKKDMRRKNQLEKELRELQKNVVSGTDEELRAQLKSNKELRAKLKLTQNETKILQAQTKQQKTLKMLVKDDIKTIKEKIKAQFKFIDALKTTEGKYKAIKKAAGAVGKGAKMAGIGAMGIAAGAMAIGSAAMGSAAAQVDREREANRIKAAMDFDDKKDLLSRLYIQTGADYSSIVDAINRVTSVLGIHDPEGIERAAAAEIRYPGAAAMFRQQNTEQAGGMDFTEYANRMRAVQSATGATIEQVQDSTARIANLRQSNFSNASMTDLQGIYLALQNSGAYDTQEELDRAFNSFLRANRTQRGDVFEFAKNYFTSDKTQTRGVYGATNRQQARQALSQISWGRVEQGARTIASGDYATDAEKTAQEMRKFEESRNKMMMSLVRILQPVLEELDKVFSSDEGQEIVQGLVDFLTKAVPVISQGIGKLFEGVEALIGFVQKIAEKLKLTDSTHKTEGEPPVGVSGKPRANGGVAMMPSIAGEAGPEMIVPLDYSRASRGVQLTQNLVQHFSMSGNETTALSLSQAVKSRDFTRAMASNSFLSSRMGR